MKEVSGLKGVHLYEDTTEDKAALAASKIFSREARGRFSVGRNYQFIGFCHVDESTTKTGAKINAWDGILVRNTKTGVEFPASPNTLLGLTFTGSNESGWKPNFVSAQKWIDVPELDKAVKAKNQFSCKSVEKIPAQDFETGSAITKDMPIFADAIM
jgi:hypothetical protein